jgi:CubicO group peptidase (beta-lactamase class C family)
MISGIYGNPEASPAGQRANIDVSLTLAESADIIADVVTKEGLMAQPGTRYSYSGAGFQVAGRVAEIATGKTFDALLQEQLAKPLRLSRTTFEIKQEYLPLMETIYVPSLSGGWEVAARPRDMWDTFARMKLVVVEGGIISTTHDYLTFLQMHSKGGKYGSTRVLSEKAVAEMQKLNTKGLQRGKGSETYPEYCMGWFADRMDAQGQPREFHHSGLYGTYGWVDLDRDLVGFFVTNQPYSLAQEIFQPIHSKILEIFPGPVPTSSETQPSIRTIDTPPVIEEFSVSPAEIKAGSSATLTWLVTGRAVYGTIEPSVTDLVLWRSDINRIAGTKEVSPAQTITYTIKATNAFGEATKSVTLVVK